MKTPGQELYERSANTAATWGALTRDTRNSWEREAYHKTIAARLAAAEQMAQALDLALAIIADECGSYQDPRSNGSRCLAAIRSARAAWDAAK